MKDQGKIKSTLQETLEEDGWRFLRNEDPSVLKPFQQKLLME